MEILQWIRAHGCNSEVTLPRAALGICTGAIAGGLFVAAGDEAWSMATSQQGSTLFGMVWPVASGVFALGLLAVSPLWAALHRIGVRCWSAAMPSGTLLSGLAALALFGDFYVAGLTGVAGGLAGLVTWRVAYRTTGACAVRAA